MYYCGKLVKSHIKSSKDIALITNALTFRNKVIQLRNFVRESFEEKNFGKANFGALLIHEVTRFLFSKNKL